MRSPQPAACSPDPAPRTLHIPYLRLMTASASLQATTIILLCMRHASADPCLCYGARAPTQTRAPHATFPSGQACSHKGAKRRKPRF
jgi:hypothetical protein